MCYLGGFAASVLATALFLPGESATDRAATAGAAGRLDAWGYGLRAVFDRPVLGWGPGRFRAAVQGRFSAGFTAANARDEVTQIWWDAHNIVVNTAVTLGIVGVGMAAIFGFLVVARARGPLAWFAGTVASSWLLQPAGLATLPLVLFCLGAASVSTAPTQSGLASDGEGRSARTQVARVGLLLGLAGALLVVLADVHVKVAAESGSADEVAAAARHLPWDPVVADLASEAYLVYGSGPTALDQATIWADKAVDRERDRPYYLNRLAALQLAANELETARHTLDTALAEQPWNVTSWTLLGVVAERTDDDELGGRVAGFCAQSWPRRVNRVLMSIPHRRETTLRVLQLPVLRRCDVTRTDVDTQLHSSDAQSRSLVIGTSGVIVCKANWIAAFIVRNQISSVLLVGVGGRPRNDWEGLIETAIGNSAERVVWSGLHEGEPGNWLDVVADGLKLPFRDASFDLVYSNAVIEHVGDGADQRRFMAEHRRVGRCWVVTTPNRWFPIESHTRMVLLHWLPSWRSRRAEFTRLLSRVASSDISVLRSRVQSSRRRSPVGALRFVTPRSLDSEIAHLRSESSPKSWVLTAR